MTAPLFIGRTEYWLVLMSERQRYLLSVAIAKGNYRETRKKLRYEAWLKRSGNRKKSEYCV